MYLISSSQFVSAANKFYCKNQNRVQAKIILNQTKEFAMAYLEDQTIHMKCTRFPNSTFLRCTNDSKTAIFDTDGRQSLLEFDSHYSIFYFTEEHYQCQSKVFKPWE